MVYHDTTTNINGKIPLKIKRLTHDAVIPRYAKPGDAGFDLVATEDVTIYAGETKLVPTGIAFGIPAGYEIQVRPRSGISAKTPIRVILGTVDSGYIGEVKVITQNTAFGGKYVVQKGERIAQAVLKAVPIADFEVVDELDATDRGVNGFGSTGTEAK